MYTHMYIYIYMYYIYRKCMRMRVYFCDGRERIEASSLVSKSCQIYFYFQSFQVLKFFSKIAHIRRNETLIKTYLSNEAVMNLH